HAPPLPPQFKPTLISLSLPPPNPIYTSPSPHSHLKAHPHKHPTNITSLTSHHHCRAAEQIDPSAPARHHLVQHHGPVQL
uniref:Uncharacterized protein n=1 Tax=Aegilops tauschii subsp. strangulata TaxID=200361 RepID=A0A453QHC8_AEGTS